MTTAVHWAETTIILLINHLTATPPDSQIWTAAEDEQRGFLTQQEFYVALKLIACAQNGQLAAEPVLSTVGG